MTQKKSAGAADSAAPDWQPTVSGDATLELSAVPAGRSTALQMNFRFNRGGGFVVAKQVRMRSMPEEYTVRFRVRGRGAAIQLELKLADPSGRNVWRHVIKDLSPPARWKRMVIESRDIEFAWGPAGSGGISQLGSMEIAVVSSAAAQGTLWIADLQIEDSLAAEPPTASASSVQPGFDASRALAGPGWKPRADDLRPWIVVDMIQPRRLGGLVIDWLGAAPAGGFRLRGSNSGRRWNTLYVAATAGGAHSYLYLPGTHVRFLRLEFPEPCGGAALHLQSFEFSRSIDAFWYNLARAEPRGWHPRWLHREQTVWTPIGTSHGVQCALMNADGMVEVSQGSFSIEPMLQVGGKLFTWAQVAGRQELLDGWMPVPSVIWETSDWRLTIQGEITDSGVVRVRYRLENLTAGELSARLFVLLRPFQVTPPWQSFRGLGGVSSLTDLEWRDGAVSINRAARIVPDTEPTGFGAMTFDAGIMAFQLAAGTLPATHEVHDEFGFATGALAFDLSAQAHATEERVVSHVPPAAARVPDEPRFDWSRQFAVSQWSGNGWIGDAIRAALTAAAHILVTRSGPALQPGPRRYTRSWIRDGAMMSAALLRMGHGREVREFIRWYAPHQRADGFVPCCVDREGVDWLVEHDSHGQLIALIADYHRFTGDSAFLRDCWTFVERAAGCIEGLLDATGLLPISVSHEGYLAQPVHSYWDDFWALRGLRDAVGLARELGLDGLVNRWEAVTTRFAAALFASIATTRAERKLDYIPGSIEWADFDPTATANAIYLLDIPPSLDRAAVERTFDKYLADWRAKRSGAVDWSNYTPYEIRIIGALVRMERRDAALELLRFFLSDRRPPPWNQWPEIAWRDPDAPAHVGDLPHTWIAGEYVLAVRALFAYERETDRSLIVAAGLAPEWIEGQGVSVDAMPTLYGDLSYSLRKIDSHTLQFQVGAGITARLILRPPLAGPLASVTIDGTPCTDFGTDSVVIPKTPARVLCTTRR
jgi:hypothetical protein